MSLSASHAHEFVSASPSPANALSDTEPPDEWKRQIKERINTNLQKLYQDADDLYKRRLQEVRSEDERARLKEDYKLEIGRIRALGGEEYHTQLELERQQRKWAMGQPIDAKWKDALEREHRKIFESYKPAGSSADSLRPNGSQNTIRSPMEERTNPVQRATITVPEYNPPPLPPEIEQKKREDRPPPRVRRESDAVPASAKEEYRHAAYFPNTEDRYYEPWARNVTEEPESSMYHISNKSRASVERSPALDRSDEDRPSTRASERPTRTGTERYALSPKHEIWRPNANAEDEPNNTRRSLARRGSSASQRSVGSTSIRSLTAEPILERPDGNENGGMARKGDGEKATEPSDKGKERQNQSRTFQIATEQGEPELPFASNLKQPPNSAPPTGRLSSDRPSGTTYAYPPHPPQRSASVKLPPPPSAHDDDRAFPHPPLVYKSPRRHGSKSSFTTESIDFRYIGPSSSVFDGPIHEHDYPYRSSSTVHGHRPVIPKPSFNNIVDRADDDGGGGGGGRYGAEWYSAPGRRSRMGSVSSRDYSQQVDDWTGSVRSRNYVPYNPFTDDSYVNYRKQSPERPRPSLARGSSFTSNRSVDDYDVGGYSEAYQRRPSLSSSIPINRGKQPRSSADEYAIPSWHDWTKHPEGRPPRPSPDSRTSYEIYSPPSSFNASSSYPARPHNFGGRETNDHRRNDHVPESELERMRQRYEELTEEAAKIEEAEKIVKEKIEEAERKEEQAKKKQEEAKKLEDEAKRKKEEARKLEEELKKKGEETKRKEEEVKRKEEETKRKEEEIRLKEEETRLKEEEARLKHEEARLKEEEVRLKEEEARLKDEEATRKEEETRRKEDEIKKKEVDARRKEREVHKKEQEAKRKELEAKRLEEDARRRDEDARRREEETERREEEIERREEDIRKREEELKRREEELIRREVESRHEEKLRLMEEEAQREREEEERRQEDEAARLREEAKREEAARQEEERRHRIEEDKRRREGEKRRRDEERQQRLEAEMKMIEEERRRIDEERARREEERRRIEEERKRRDEEEAARRQEDENRRKEQEAAVKRQQEEDKRRKQEGEWRKEQERIHEEVMRREWEKRRNESNAHTAQQGAYEKQREEILKRKGEGRKPSSSPDTGGFMSSSPTGTGSASPLSSSRPNAPQRQASTASAWASASGSAWKTAAATSSTSPSSSTPSSARSSTSSTTSATSASSSVPTSTPTPKPKAPTPSNAASSSGPPLSESEWARRQAEQAKEQQERFRREQEKLENQRIANEINKTVTERDLAQLYQMHEARWKDLNAFDVLRWDTFPWPLVRRPKTAEDIKEMAIQAYLFSKGYPEKDYKSDKDRVKEHIKRWHPDKFNTKYLPKVIEEDKERVREGAGAVVRGLNAILTRMNEPQHPGLFG